MTLERDNLRERWRLSAVEAAQADDRAARAKEGKTIFLDQLIESLVEQSEERLSQAKAERMARTSDAYKKYLRSMHNARLKADLLRIAERDLDRQYWASVSSEATYRVEARLHQ